MFWFLCVISAFAYAVQQTFMIHYIRKMDPFSVAMYRTLSLGISMSPLLFFSTIPEILEIKNYIGVLAFSSLLGGISLAMAFTMIHYLPIGISSAISSGARVIIMLIIGFLYFEELLSPITLFLIALIIGGNFFLGISSSKNKSQKLKKFNLVKGSFYVLIQGALVAISFMIMGWVSRQMDPLVVAYAWETMIGISLVCVGLLRWFFFKIPLQKISLKGFLDILWICSPTLIGTGAFALAVTMGSIGIVGAIGTSSIVFVTVLAYLFYDEKLSKLQFLALGIISLGIIGIKILG